METDFLIQIVPNTFDPDEDVVLFLQKLSVRLRDAYQTDVTAKVEADGLKAVTYRVFLAKQKVEAYGSYPIPYITKANKDDNLDNPAHVFTRLLDDAIRKFG